MREHVETVCPRCSEPAADFRFCPSCGLNLEPAQPRVEANGFAVHFESNGLHAPVESNGHPPAPEAHEEEAPVAVSNGFGHHLPDVTPVFGAAFDPPPAEEPVDETAQEAHSLRTPGEAPLRHPGPTAGKPAGQWSALVCMAALIGLMLLFTSRVRRRRR